MRRERIRSHPNWRGQYPRRDTVLVSVGSEDDSPMRGTIIGRVFLFLAVHFREEILPAALVHWFSPTDVAPHSDTGLWVVRPEYVADHPTMTVIPLGAIVCAAHLMPVFGSAFLPEGFEFTSTLDAFHSYFVNAHVDHHMYEFLK
jgi:hypothetical protein